MTKLKPTGRLRARASSNHYYLVRPYKNFPDFPELLYDSINDSIKQFKKLFTLIINIKYKIQDIKHKIEIEIEIK